MAAAIIVGSMMVDRTELTTVERDGRLPVNATTPQRRKADCSCVVSEADPTRIGSSDDAE